MTASNTPMSPYTQSAVSRMAVAAMWALLMFSASKPHCLLTIMCLRNQEKETATKIASDAAATAQKQADGKAENATPGSPVATGGADLDAYIKSLLSTPAPGGGAEEDGRSPPPAPGESHCCGIMLLIFQFVFDHLASAARIMASTATAPALPNCRVGVASDTRGVPRPGPLP